jgi:hypothetical protein
MAPAPENEEDKKQQQSSKKDDRATHCLSNVQQSSLPFNKVNLIRVTSKFGIIK